MDEEELKQLRIAIAEGVSAGVKTGIAQAEKNRTDPSSQGGFSGVKGKTNFDGFFSSTQQATHQTDKFGRMINEAGGSLSANMGDLAKRFKDVPIIETLAGASNSIVSFIEETNDTFQKLSKVGAGLEGRLSELRIGAADTRMPLGTFANMVGSNAELLAGFQGGVTGGIKVFRNLSKAMMEGDTINQFQNLGFTLEESNEFILKNLEVQRRQARFRNRDGSLSEQAMLEASLRMAKSLDVMAKVAGKQLDQMQDEIINRQRVGATDAKLRLLEQQGIIGARDAYDRANEALAGAPKVTRDLLAELVQTGVPMSAATKQFASLNGEAYDALRKQAMAIKSGDTEAAAKLGAQATAATVKSVGSTQNLTVATLAGVSEIAQNQANVLEETGPLIDQIQNTAKRTGVALQTTEDYVKVFNRILEEAQARTDTQAAGGGQDQELSVTVNEIQRGLANTASELNKFIGQQIRGQTEIANMIDGAAKEITRGLDLTTQFFKGINNDPANPTNLPPEQVTNLQTELDGRNVTAERLAEIGRIVDGMGYMIDDEMQIVKKARLLGGMVNKGKVYTIGEQGPETFVPGMDGAIIPNMKSMLNKMPDLAKQMSNNFSPANMRNMMKAQPDMVKTLQDEVAMLGAPVSEAARTAAVNMQNSQSVEEKLDILNQSVLQLVGINNMQAQIGNKQIKTMRSTGNFMQGIGRV